MSFETSWPLIAVIVVVILFIVGKVALDNARAHAANREALRAAQKRREAEIQRVAALPKIRTHYLMQVPEALTGCNPLPRTYGTRYNRILIFDESGRAWVGLATHQIIEDLAAGEYLLRDYNIPFRGAGERCAGPVVLYGDVRIDVYPIWMEKETNLADWKLWARIELNFRAESSANWNYQNGLLQLHERQDEFTRKRDFALKG